MEHAGYKGKAIDAVDGDGRNCLVKLGYSLSPILLVVLMPCVLTAPVCSDLLGA